MNNNLTMQSPNVLNFALIGAGKFGRNYIRLLQEIDGIQLKTVVSQSELDPQIVLPSTTLVCKDVKAVLADSAIDCVVIATPPATHFAIAKQALEHQKHVFVEKPMVVSIQEADALKKIVDDTGRTFMVGFQYLFNDSIRYLKKEIENDSFGTLSEFKVEHVFSPKRADVSCFWDVAPHALSLFQFFFEPTRIAEIKGHSQKIESGTQDDSVEATVRFDRGPLLSIHASWLGKEKVRRIGLIGEKKTALLDETKSVNKLSIIEHGHSVTLDIHLTEPLRNELEHFIHCVRSRQKPLTDIVFGSLITRWLETISHAITMS